MIRFSTLPERDQDPITSAPFNRYTFEDGTVWTEFHRTDEGYRLRFPDLADFDVSADGKEIVAYPAPGADESTVEHLYLNQMVPLALSRQGRPAFHASVVSTGSGAIAFLGQSGMGKSTLAASFSLSGYSFLTDDALLINEQDDHCMAVPSHASIRLWDDSVDALMSDADSTLSVVSFSSKSRLYAGDVLTHSDATQPLLAAFLLKDHDTEGVEIHPLEGAERQMAWINNSFLLDIEDTDLLTAHFDWTHRISQAVPTYSLDYPRDYGILEKVRTTILSHIDIAGSLNGSR